jgi:hypothetical protein
VEVSSNTGGRAAVTVTYLRVLLGTTETEADKVHVEEVRVFEGELDDDEMKVVGDLDESELL